MNEANEAILRAHRYAEDRPFNPAVTLFEDMMNEAHYQAEREAIFAGCLYPMAACSCGRHE